MGASLICDGLEVDPWEAQIGYFKTAFAINDPRLIHQQVGPKYQNEMIRLNDLTPEYCQWMNTCLNVAGDPTGLGVAEKRRKAVMAIQKGSGMVEAGPARRPSGRRWTSVSRRDLATAVSMLPRSRGRASPCLTGCSAGVSLTFIDAPTTGCGPAPMKFIK